MKVVLSIVLILFVIFLIVLIAKQDQPSEIVRDPLSTEHIYATWDIMEFDKCVAAWLIVRFIDEDAKFVLYPQGTEIKQGVVFDVPGAAWSRKHQKCTSDCILESLDINDPAVERIVEMAHQTELNFWQLDRWPETQKCFDDVRQIIKTVPDQLQCYKRTRTYFDMLYDRLRQQSGRGDED